MTLLPTGSNDLQQDFRIVTRPSKTWLIDPESKRLRGWATDEEAVRQAAYLALSTERYQWLIFSWDYGVELAKLFGKPMDYVASEVERRVQECLLRDDRIDNVSDFVYSIAGRSLSVSFKITTKEGAIINQDLEVQA